jgi:dTDP-4-amino-4,6-dideoxygalactose transaminase
MVDHSKLIPIAKPDLGEAEASAARSVILSGWVSQGPEVAAFEADFAQKIGALYACAVSSGTTALHVALLVAGIKPGDEVITVSHSFIATANAVSYCGASPIFVDIDPDTFNLDPSRLAAAMTSKTRGILCVHQLGMPCDVRAIVKFGRAHAIPVIEDAACAIGSAILGPDGALEPIGRPHGDIACFSFHPRKVITTGDGGMITTCNHDHDRRFRLLRHHGMSIPDTLRHAAAEVMFESYDGLGYNYRMTDIQAAVGRAQLKRLDEMVRSRRALAARYAEQLTIVPGLVLPREPPWARSNWQSFCVRLPGGCQQRAVMQFMLDRNVATRRGVTCAHREPGYAELPRRHPLAHSEAAQDQCILLPLYPQMTLEEQQTVVEALDTAVRTVRGR